MEPEAKPFDDAYLPDDVRAAIHDFSLHGRDLLTAEVRDLLTSVYGLRVDGSFEPPSHLPALDDPETRATYDQLRVFLEDEVVAGLERREAIEKLVKETAFTHLNRLVAFRMLEARKLIRETVGRGVNSNGFKFYLAEHPEDLARQQDGSADTAYRRFLLWQAGQVAQQVRVLFDPANLPSRLFPRPSALNHLLERLNDPRLAPAWLAEETIGWVYQFFNEAEKAAVFDRLFKQKEKIRREDIPAATQLFTPRWIVRFLVENTLGRLWVQMHPETRLKAALRYLVPLAGEVPPEPLRAAREITLLDPACGTMHFGLVAFDLFAAMYQEELERAGQPGWPATASVAAESDVPAAILRHNLYGIDIDLRAVQLAALTLFLKAKRLNKDARISDHNLACADVLPLDGKRLDAFLKETTFSRPIYARLIRALWEKLEDINQLGSLLRLEVEVGALVAAERERFELEGRQLDIFGEGAAQYEGEAADADYWEQLGAQVIQALETFARAHAAQGRDERLFVNEAEKGLRVLEVMQRRYDCVVANPPYMSRGNMNETLAGFLVNAYSEAKGDLYAAFIARCTELAGAQGRVGMITQQSFMFISSYEELRTGLLDEFAIETMAHTGPRAFAEISGEKVNTAAFVLRRDFVSVRRLGSAGVFFRLVHEPNSVAKHRLLRQALSAIQSDSSSQSVYRVRQIDFGVIPGSPWVYWISDRVRGLFASFPSLQTIAPPKQGLTTANNPRFVRFWWEVGVASIQLSCGTLQDAARSGARWFPLTKGGAARWRGIEQEIVNWGQDGVEIKTHITTQYPYLKGNWEWVAKNSDVYFRPGVAFTRVGPSGFTARLSPKGRIIESSLSGAYPKSPLDVLAILNSNVAFFLLNCLNPTINFQAGDVAKIPFPITGDFSQVRSTGGYLIRLASLDLLSVETSYDYLAPQHWSQASSVVNSTPHKLEDAERKLNDQIFSLYGVSGLERQAVEAELAGAIELAEAEVEDVESEDDLVNEPVNPDVVLNREYQAVQSISYAVGTILGRFQPGRAGALGSAIYRKNDFTIGSLPVPDDREFDELVGPAESFAYVDKKGGRHRFPEKVEEALRALTLEDGIAVLDEGHPRDLPVLVGEALDLMLGAAVAQAVIEAGAGGDLRTFLERDFFIRWHCRWYRKRPVYWPIQSARRGYGFVLFHERITKDTLYLLQREPYLETKRKAVDQALGDLQDELKGKAGRERRAVERQIEEQRRLADELGEFAKALEAITRAGYAPEPNWIDDGVILRMAPLWPVIPIWQAEPKKYWARLEKGDFDWSHIAMRYRPRQVLEACRRNKSYAIAHGREDLYQGKQK